MKKEIGTRTNAKTGQTETISILYRDATKEDIPFLVDIIVQGLGSRTERLSYQKIFDISNAEFRQMMLEVLDNDIEHHDFTYKSFQIVEHNGKAIGGLCSWIEGFEGYSSKDIKANILKDYLGFDLWMKKLPLLSKISKYDITRDFGALQYEYAFLRFRYWGYNILEGFFAYSNAKHRKLKPDLMRAQAQIFRGNQAIIRVLKSLGFKEEKEVYFPDELKDIYPTSSLVMLESIIPK